MKKLIYLRQAYRHCCFQSWLLLCLLLISYSTSQAQTQKKAKTAFQTGHWYRLRNNQSQPIRYTRSYSGSNGAFVTTYKLYHPIRGTWALTVTATHYKDDQKIIVKLNDTSGSIFSEINTEETTYEGTPLSVFGFRGAVGALGGHNVPNQLGLQFASGKAENVKVLSIAGSSEDGDFDFFTLDKEARLSPSSTPVAYQTKATKPLQAISEVNAPKVTSETNEAYKATEAELFHSNRDIRYEHIEPVLADTLPGSKVYSLVEQMPELPGGGGKQAIQTAIQKALRYPPKALSNKIQGTVTVSFMVNSQGDVQDIEVIQGLEYGLDEETIRAVRSLPKFMPGQQEGQTVNVGYTLPLYFKIQ